MLLIVLWELLIGRGVDVCVVGVVETLNNDVCQCQMTNDFIEMHCRVAAHYLGMHYKQFQQAARGRRMEVARDHGR